jgi:O-antigen ligase
VGRWDREHWAYGLFLAHLALLGALALSNILLASALLLVLLDPKLRARLWIPFPGFWWVAAYWGSLLLAVLASRDLTSSFRHLTETFSLASFVLVPVLVRSTFRAQRMVDTMILAAMFFAGVGLLQLGFGFGDLDRRIRGPFSHYMTFSGVLVLAGLLLLARYLMAVRVSTSFWIGPWNRARLLGLGGLLLLGTALVATLTRSSWLAAAAAGVALVAAVDWKRLWLVLVLVAAFVLLAPVSTLVRVASIADPEEVSNYDRLCMAWSGLKMLTHRPLLGLGPGEVKREYPIYRHPTAPRRTVPHLHNSYLQLAAERGLVGALVFLFWMVSSLRRAWKVWRLEQGAVQPSDLALGITGALLGALINASFEDTWGDTEVQRYWLALLGLAWVLPLPQGPDDGFRSPLR